MDQTDRKILRILAENAAVTATEMVPQVNLSIPAINKRIQKLRESGVIRRFTVLVEPEEVPEMLVQQEQKVVPEMQERVQLLQVLMIS